MTHPTQLVLEALLRQPIHRWYGLELRRETGLEGGTLYPLVARLEQLGWLESRWEEPEDHEGTGRPRRRYYWLTQDGAQQAASALSGRRRLLQRLVPEVGS